MPDIQGHLADIYDIDVSPDLISKITDAVIEEVREGRPGRWSPSGRSSSLTQSSARSATRAR
jgi:hypothetical protein